MNGRGKSCGPAYPRRMATGPAARAGGRRWRETRISPGPPASKPAGPVASRWQAPSAAPCPLPLAAQPPLAVLSAFQLLLCRASVRVLFVARTSRRARRSRPTSGRPPAGCRWHLAGACPCARRGGALFWSADFQSAAGAGREARRMRVPIGLAGLEARGPGEIPTGRMPWHLAGACPCARRGGALFWSADFQSAAGAGREARRMRVPIGLAGLEARGPENCAPPAAFIIQNSPFNIGRRSRPSAPLRLCGRPLRISLAPCPPRNAEAFRYKMPCPMRACSSTCHRLPPSQAGLEARAPENCPPTTASPCCIHHSKFAIQHWATQSHLSASAPLRENPSPLRISDWNRRGAAHFLH